MIGAASIVVSALDTPEHHIVATAHQSDGELDIDLIGVKDNFTGDGDAALAETHLVASTGKAEGSSEAFDGLASLGMEGGFGISVVGDASFGQCNQHRGFPEGGDGFHTGRAQHGLFGPVFKGKATDVAGEQKHGGILIDLVPGLFAIRNCGVERGERFRDRGNRAGG